MSANLMSAINSEDEYASLCARICVCRHKYVYVCIYVCVCACSPGLKQVLACKIPPLASVRVCFGIIIALTGISLIKRTLQFQLCSPNCPRPGRPQN